MDNHNFWEALGNSPNKETRKGNKAVFDNTVLDYIPFEITGHFCNLVGSQQCDSFTYRTIFGSKRYLFFQPMRNHQKKGTNKFLSLFFEKNQNWRSVCYIYTMTFLFQKLQIKYEIGEKQNIHAHSYHTVIFFKRCLLLELKKNKVRSMDQPRKAWIRGIPPHCLPPPGRVRT